MQSHGLPHLESVFPVGLHVINEPMCTKNAPLVFSVEGTVRGEGAIMTRVSYWSHKGVKIFVLCVCSSVKS